MRKSRLALLILVLFAFYVPNANARNKALIIAGGGMNGGGDYNMYVIWNNAAIMYNRLLQNGYNHEDIVLLFGMGTDGDQLGPNYIDAGIDTTITDYASSLANLNTVCNSLNSSINSNDQLFIYITGHSDTLDVGGGGIVKLLFDQTITTTEDTLAFYLAKIQNYKKKIIVLDTCFSGRYLDALNSDRTVIISGSSAYQPIPTSNSLYNDDDTGFGIFWRSKTNWLLCDTFFYDYTDLNQSCDLDDDNIITPYEVYQHLNPYDQVTTPQILDDDNLQTKISIFTGGYLYNAAIIKFDMNFNENVYVGENCSAYLGESGEDTRINLTFDSGKKLYLSDNLTISQPTKLTKSGSSNWGGIEIGNSGSLSASDSLFIENITGNGIYSSSTAQYPIDFSSNNAHVTISGFSQNGIYLTNSSPKQIKNVKFLKNGATAFSSITITGASSNPEIDKTTVHNSYYGVYLDSYANATIKNTAFDDSISYRMIYMNSSAGLNIDEQHNNFYHDLTYCPNGTTKYAIQNSTTKRFYVDYNYFGGKNPTSSTDKAKLFSYPDSITSGTYISSPYASAGAPKIAGTISYKNPFINAQAIEEAEDANYKAQEVKTEDWSGSVAVYKEILTNYTDPDYRRQAIKSLISVYQKSKRDFGDLREIISSELKNYETLTDSWYRESMDFLYAETYIREKDYSRAISEFESRVDGNAGTPMEVEMLSRIANIYGDMLGDRSTAKTYADRAAAKNPGQGIVLAAYHSAGIDYDPFEYTDIFAEKEAESDKPAEGEAIATTTSGGSISVSPNPANPSTVLTYNITNASKVKLSVYAINGQKVATLVDGNMSAGTHIVRFDGSKYGSGLYFYKFESPGFNKSGKFMLVK